MYLSVLMICFSLLAFSGCQKKPAPSESVEQVNSQRHLSPDFKNAAMITSSYESASESLVVQVKLSEGFHAYAPLEKIGKPVSLAIVEKNGWHLASPIDLPEGKKKTLSALGESQVLEGTFTIKAAIAGGSGPVFAELGLQICTAEVCDRPRVHTFSVDAVNEKSK